MADEGLFGASTVSLGTLLGTDRVHAARSGVSGKTIADLNAIAAFVNAAAAVNEPAWSLKAFGATGNGTSDDTAAVQSAVDSGEHVFVPPGVYSVDTIELPSDGSSTSIIGLSPQACQFKARTTGGDIFHAGFSGTVQTRPGSGKQVMLANLAFELNTSATDTSAGFNRCTTSGYAIGAAAIAFERTNFLNGNTSASINDAWCTNFNLFSNLQFEVTTKNSTHRQVGFHSQGNVYGTRWMGMWAEGPHGLITVAVPFVRRVTANASTDAFTVSDGSGANAFANGDQVRVKAHDITGGQPGSVDKETTYFVINKSGATFQISTTSGGSALNITSAGSGTIYVVREGPGIAVFSPDETFIGQASIYSSPYGIGVTNPERLVIDGYTSYANQTILEIDSIPSTTSRVRAISCHIDGVYSESPQTAQGLPNNDCVLIDCDGLFVGMMQVRGATGGSRPKYRFEGNDHFVASLDARSSVVQEQPDVFFNAPNTVAFGQVHNNGTVTRAFTSGADSFIGRIRKGSGTGNFVFDLTE